MTAKEAIGRIREHYTIHMHKEPHAIYITEALQMAVDALEKQIPKKPGYTKLRYKCNGEDIEINHPECPYCRTHGLSLWDAAIPVGDIFCRRCGQAIDWSEDKS